MDQHVISAWLLRAFARGAGRPLVRYDKLTREYGETNPEEFLTEIDGHSVQIEQDIQRIETPAAEAARRLRKLVTKVPPGLYAVTPEGSGAVTSGPDLIDVGVYERTRVLVSQRTIPSPSTNDRLALARYVGLMYQRGPKIESAMLGLRDAFDRGAQLALDQLLPGTRAKLRDALPDRRARLVPLALKMAPRLADSRWWVYRVRDGDGFILGDTPVAATLSLGHEADVWRGILSDQTFAVVLPLGSQYALIIAPQGIIPVTGIEADDLPAVLNRMTLRWAQRYVVARDRSHIESAVATVPDDQLEWDVPISINEAEVSRSGGVMVTRFYTDYMLRQMGVMPSLWLWAGCRLWFGLYPWLAEDRPYVVSIGLLPRCQPSTRVTKNRAA